MSSKYIPYVKYLLAPDTRFERDHAIFFAPKGRVARGKPLINYGWGYGGLKGFIKIYFDASRKDDKESESYYWNLRKYRGNVLAELESDRILQLPLRGLITAKIHENVFVPILVVDFTSIKFKYCETCLRRWEGKAIPSQVETRLGRDNASQEIRRMRCTRMACNRLCGNYRNCILNYTSMEEDPDNEQRILDCLSSLIELLYEGVEPSKMLECRERESSDDRPKPVGPLAQDSKCFERPVRFDFTPIRRRHIDPITWRDIQDQRMDHGAHHIIDLIPSCLLPDVLEDQVRRVDVNAPLDAQGVFESFMQMAKIRFEIRVDFLSHCRICGGQHRLSKVPISAMFKTDLAYVQESGFGKMLWRILWEQFPKQMCSIYPRESSIASSPVLKRELSISDLGENVGNFDYDYAVNFEPITGSEGWLLFDLTTGLWKKGGFHETSLKPEDYVKRWKEMFVKIPSKLENTKTMWYVVIPNTEDQFFDDSSPSGIDSMSALLSAIADHNSVLNPVVVFNSTPRKGEARTELRNLADEKYIDKTKAYLAVCRMLRETV